MAARLIAGPSISGRRFAFWEAGCTQPYTMRTFHRSCPATCCHWPACTPRYDGPVTASRTRPRRRLPHPDRRRTPRAGGGTRPSSFQGSGRSHWSVFSTGARQDHGHRAWAFSSAVRGTSRGISQAVGGTAPTSVDPGHLTAMSGPPMGSRTVPPVRADHAAMAAEAVGASAPVATVADGEGRRRRAARRLMRGREDGS